jgi:hypothetical protein
MGGDSQIDSLSHPPAEKTSQKSLNVDGADKQEKDSQQIPDALPLMDSKIYTPLPPPVSAGATPRKDLTASETDKQQKVFQHFSEPDYALPGVEKGQLTEAEKFWLV